MKRPATIVGSFLNHASSGMTRRQSFQRHHHHRRRRRLWALSSNFSSSSSSSSSTLEEHAPELVPPARIILVRHGQSMGNVDEETYARIPDWKIALTDKGVQQAREAGLQLASLLEEARTTDHSTAVGGLQQQHHPPQSIVTYCSPYCRALQTWKEMQGQLNQDQIIGMRQDPRLAEQQFGNFQNPTKVLASKEERHLFGRFFYRFPNGESGLDVYSRVTSFLGSLNRDMTQLQNRGMIGFDMNNVNVLCVTHGLTLRLFVMRYFQLSVEEFEETKNPFNCHLIVMDRRHNGHYYYYQLNDESKHILNLQGDISTEKPVFWRNIQ